MLKPQDVDVSNRYILQDTFGCAEFEDAAIKIVKYLQDDELHIPSGFLSQDTNYGGWNKPFRIDSIPGITPTMFAMLCCSGWMSHLWFPKGVFVVSDAFVQRIERKMKTCQLKSKK